MAVFHRPYVSALRELTRAQLRLKNQSTFFGFLWSILHPLFLLTLLFVLFSSRVGEGIHHYAMYLLIGIVHYTHFANSTGAAMLVLHSMRRLTSDVIFPKELLVMATVSSRSLEFVVSAGICVAIGYLSGIEAALAVIQLPLILLLQLVLVFWVSLVLAALYLFVRDIQHVYQVFLRMLFFASPIFYDLDLLGQGAARYVVLANPLTHLMGYSRRLLIEGEWLDPAELLVFFGVNAVIIVTALGLFRRAEPVFAEKL
jgi:ABC-type polysaccharide/polyol phosphate export permease